MGEGSIEKTSSSVQTEKGSQKLRGKDSLTFIHSRHERAIGPKVVIAPGLGETAEGSFTDTSASLAKRGHDVFALTHPDTKPDDEYLKTEKEAMMASWIKKFGKKIPASEARKLFEKIPLTEFRKALTLIAFIEKTVQDGHTDAVDVIGHSQGGAYALIAAFLRPDLFSKLILVNPAGQSREGFFRMLRKFHTTMFVDAIRSGKWKHVGDTIYSLLSHVGMGYIRAIRQGWNLSGFDGYPYLKVLNIIAPKIKRVTMYDSADRIFRKQRIEDAARAARRGIPEEQVFGERKRTENMGHYGPVTYPEEYADMFHDILAH